MVPRWACRGATPFSGGPTITILVMITALEVSGSSSVIHITTALTRLIILTALHVFRKRLKSCDKLFEVCIVAIWFIWVEFECTFEVCSPDLCHARVLSYTKNCIAIHLTEGFWFGEANSYAEIALVTRESN